MVGYLTLHNANARRYCQALNASYLHAKSDRLCQICIWFVHETPFI